jgi:trypsin
MSDGDRHTDRIIGGQPATPGKYPSFVFRGCGGTLIHPDMFLTAAHCKGSFYFGVFVGGIRLNGSDGEALSVEVEVQHPRFRPNSPVYNNDIMIVKVSSNSTAPIQKLNFDKKVPFRHETLTTVGFGWTDEVHSQLSEVLQEVNVSVINYSDCRRAYRAILNKQVICAGRLGVGGKDSCYGDSGGPLYTTGGVQVGVTSFGEGCGRPKYPGVYTRISNYKDFIIETICNHSSVPPSSCLNLPTPECPC